jgi:hypothetical protein
LRFSRRQQRLQKGSAITDFFVLHSAFRVLH